MTRASVLESSAVSAARRLLGADTEMCLAPLWQTLAAASTHLTFDDAYPRAHASWLYQQDGDWAAV
jgi:hypothetical protein